MEQKIQDSDIISPLFISVSYGRRVEDGSLREVLIARNVTTAPASFKSTESQMTSLPTFLFGRELNVTCHDLSETVLQVRLKQEILHSKNNEILEERSKPVPLDLTCGRPKEPGEVDVMSKRAEDEVKVIRQELDELSQGMEWEREGSGEAEIGIAEAEELAEELENRAEVIESAAGRFEIELFFHFVACIVAFHLVSWVIGFD